MDISRHNIEILCVNCKNMIGYSRIPTHRKRNLEKILKITFLFEICITLVFYFIFSFGSTLMYLLYGELFIDYVFVEFLVFLIITIILIYIEHKKHILS